MKKPRTSKRKSALDRKNTDSPAAVQDKKLGADMEALEPRIMLSATWVDADTGESVYGHDYYQDMMIWSLPATLAGEDLSGPVKPGGLVDRVVQAGKEK